MRPGPKAAIRLFGVTVMPFAAFSAVAGLVNALLEASANRWLDQDMAVLLLDRVRWQILTDTAWALLAGGACFVVLLLACRISRAATYVTPLAWAGLVVLLGTRVLYPQRWRVRTVRDDLALPALLSDWGTLANVKLAVTIAAAAALLVGLVLWRRRADPSWLWTSPLARRLGFASTAVTSIALLGSVATPLLDRGAPAGNPLPVIYLTWDSTRADHLSCYGYTRPTSPNLDDFAAEAVRYRTAISQHNWTRPSYTSILTGVPNWMLPGSRLDRSALTLAEIMKSHGYRTVGLVQNPNLDSELSFDQGFDRFTELHPLSVPATMNRFVVAELKRLAASDRPFFLFAHYQGPHWPYPRDNPFLAQFVDPGSVPVPPETVARLMKHNGRDWDPAANDAAATVASLRDLYDASIRLTDESLGEVIGVLQDLGLYDRALIVFNSDHGDEFAERDAFGHAHANVHPELTYVPLIVRLPSATPRSVDRAAQALDILPTVLAVAGIDPPGPLPGMSLIEDGRSVEPPRRIVYSNAGDLVAVRDGAHSLIMDFDSGSLVGLYDELADPAEREPLEAGNMAREPLQKIAEEWYERYRAATSGESVRQDMSEELMETLRGLGYLD